MKFKFPLKTVMRQRKIIEELAQKEFQTAQAQLQAEIDLLNLFEKQVSETHLNSYEIQSSAGQVSGALKYNFEFLKGQDIRIERQRAKVQEVEKLVEGKREILRQAALEYKIIEKLKEKKWEEFKHEYSLEEQKEMDEQSILRYKSKET